MGGTPGRVAAALVEGDRHHLRPHGNSAGAFDLQRQGNMTWRQPFTSQYHPMQFVNPQKCLAGFNAPLLLIARKFLPVLFDARYLKQGEGFHWVQVYCVASLILLVLIKIILQKKCVGLFDSLSPTSPHFPLLESSMILAKITKTQK